MRSLCCSIRSQSGTARLAPSWAGAQVNRRQHGLQGRIASWAEDRMNRIDRIERNAWRHRRSQVVTSSRALKRWFSKSLFIPSCQSCQSGLVHPVHPLLFIQSPLSGGDWPRKEWLPLRLAFRYKPAMSSPAPAGGPRSSSSTTENTTLQRFNGSTVRLRLCRAVVHAKVSQD
jgi:hypothetical protein